MSLLTINSFSNNDDEGSGTTGSVIDAVGGIALRENLLKSFVLPLFI